MAVKFNTETLRAMNINIAAAAVASMPDTPGPKSREVKRSEMLLKNEEKDAKDIDKQKANEALVASLKEVLLAAILASPVKGELTVPTHKLDRTILRKLEAHVNRELTEDGCYIFLEVAWPDARQVAAKVLGQEWARPHQPENLTICWKVEF